MNTELKLPNREEGTKLLLSLNGKALAGFNDEIINALWDAYDDGELPASVVRVIRDWLAHGPLRHLQKSSTGYAWPRSSPRELVEFVQQVYGPEKHHVIVRR